MFVENQDTLEMVTQEAERLRRGYDDFDTRIKEKIQRMRYESLEDKERLGEGFLLMLRYMFQQHKIQRDDDEAGSSGAAQWTSPCVGFYMYITLFKTLRGPDFIALSNGPCVGLSLYLFPFFEQFYSLVNVILGGIVYLV